MEKAPRGETLRGIAILAFQRGESNRDFGGSKRGKWPSTHFYCSRLCRYLEENSFRNTRSRKSYLEKYFKNPLGEIKYIILREW